MSNGSERQILGEPLEDFSLRNLSGDTVTLSGSLEGKNGGVVLFWSGVCSHCDRYDKYLNTFAERHPELRLLAIASRHGETVEDIRKTVAERKLTFPILHDPGGRLAAQWFTQQSPRVYLLDNRRTLLYRGAIDNYKYPSDGQYAAYLEPALEQFLKGESIVKPETASFGCAIQSVYYILPKAL